MNRMTHQQQWCCTLQPDNTVTFHWLPFGCGQCLLLACGRAGVRVALARLVCVGRSLLLTTNPSKRPCCWPADDVRQVKLVERQSQRRRSSCEALAEAGGRAGFEGLILCALLPTYLYNFSFHSVFCFLQPMAIVKTSCARVLRPYLCCLQSCLHWLFMSAGPPVQHSVDCLVSRLRTVPFFLVLRHISPLVIAACAVASHVAAAMWQAPDKMLSELLSANSRNHVSRRRRSLPSSCNCRTPGFRPALRRETLNSLVSWVFPRISNLWQFPVCMVSFWLCAL